MPLCESNETLKLLNSTLFWQNISEDERSDLLCEKQTMQRTLSVNSWSQCEEFDEQKPSKLLVIGGNSDDDFFTVETFCPDTNTWELSDEKIELDNCITQIYQYALIDDDLYISGATSFGLVEDVSVFSVF